MCRLFYKGNIKFMVLCILCFNCFLFSQIVSASKEVSLEAKQHFRYGCDYQSKGEIKKAILEFEQAIKIEPDYVEAIVNLGIAYGQQGQYDKAEIYLKLATEKDPNNFRAYDNLSYLYFLQGKYNKSIEACRKAIKINPNSASTHCRLGRNLLILGSMENSPSKISSAKKEFEKTLELNPSDEIAEDAKAGLRIIERGCY